MTSLSTTRPAVRPRAATQYLVEVFAPEWSQKQLQETCERVRRTADARGLAAERVRYLHAVLVPREDTAFFLFEAELPSAVEGVLEAAGLEAERISLAIPPAVERSSR